MIQATRIFLFHRHQHRDGWIPTNLSSIFDLKMNFIWLCPLTMKMRVIEIYLYVCATNIRLQTVCQVSVVRLHTRNCNAVANFFLQDSASISSRKIFISCLNKNWDFIRYWSSQVSEQVIWKVRQRQTTWCVSEIRTGRRRVMGGMGWWYRNHIWWPQIWQLLTNWKLSVSVLYLHKVILSILENTTNHL